MDTPTLYFDAQRLAGLQKPGQISRKLSGAILCDPVVDDLPGLLRQHHPEAQWLYEANPVEFRNLRGLKLIEVLGASRKILRVHFGAGTAGVVALRKTAPSVPDSIFIVDPFEHGPADAWQAKVRLAECENVFITTLGLFSRGNDSAWKETLRDVIYFITGEVGAGKLLFASGAGLDEDLADAPGEWLASIDCLDDAQRNLILRDNAAQILQVDFQ